VYKRQPVYWALKKKPETDLKQL